MAKSNYFFGEILTSKNGVKYIKVTSDVTLTLKEGDAIFMQKPEENIDALAKKGFITAEEAKARKSKLPNFLHYLIKTPQND